jgi:(p)ppGpp synthase/HD superfamily hydrolase
MDSIERQLERAFTIALRAHEAQVDKVGQPYFLHLVRVMLRVEAGPGRVVALLHDLIEDTDWTVEDLLREGFDAEIVAAVESLTRREDETYEQFTDRVMLNPLAVTVKIADLQDNMNRLEALAQIEPEKAESLGARYRQAYEKLIPLVE